MHRHAAGRERDQRKEVTQLHAGEEQHAEAGRHEHRRRAEVGLQQQQRGGAHQHAERLEESFQLLLQLGLLAHDVARQIGEQQHARQLGCLEVHDAGAQPATAAVHFVADAGNQHDHQQQEREQQQRQSEPLPHRGRNHHRDGGGEQAERDADQLALEVVQRLVRPAGRRSRSTPTSSSRGRAAGSRRRSAAASESNANRRGRAFERAKVSAAAFMLAASARRPANTSPRCA